MKKTPKILGGLKVRNKKFNPRKTMGKSEIQAVIEVLENDNLSSFIGAPGEKFLGGKKVLEFENLWKKKYGFKHAISVNSWTSGLIISVGAVGIEPGDEVICSPYTMSASATSVLFYGGIPIFADIDSNTFNIDASTIEKKITKRTKAILVVHVFGGCADMDEIMKLAKKYNLKVIEDAAQAPGIKYKNKSIGAIGDIGGFSLNFHKHIHAGEGGMIVTNNDDLAFKAQLIRNHGENYAEKLEVNDLPNIIGGNYRLTEIQAAIGVEQLKKLNPLIKHRNDLADFLHDELKNIDCLETYIPKFDHEHSYYLFPIKFDENKARVSRSLFVKAVNMEFLDAEGWESVPLSEGYVKPLYLSPIYQNKIAIGTKGFPFNYNKDVEYDYTKGLCPIAEKIYFKEMIITPLVREPLLISDMQDLIKAIKKVLLFADEISLKFKNKDAEEIFTPVSAASSKNVR
jgi:perosamine synthetase